MNAGYATQFYTQYLIIAAYFLLTLSKDLSAHIWWEAVRPVYVPV